MLMTHITEKKCIKCMETKPVKQFYKRGRGYTSYCRDCMKELSRQRTLDGRGQLSRIKYEEKHGYFRAERQKRKLLNPMGKIVSDLFFNARKRSIYGNKEFNLTREYVEQLVTDFCNKNYHVITNKKHPFKPSLDRINSNGCYTTDNIVVCWQIENYCKNTYSDSDVIEFCKRKLGLM